MDRNRTFQRVAGLKPRRNKFNLSYRNNLTCDMGQLIPVMCDECVPGDSWTIGNEVVVRFQPLAYPIMHEINVTVHYFYVPYRILWPDWERYIQQGFLPPDTGSGETQPQLPYPLPKVSKYDMTESAASPKPVNTYIWDALGLPMSTYANDPTARSVLDFPFRAYNMVYNEYYRDQDLQQPVDLLNKYILNRNWAKDYFTASRPFQQKGTAPALPVRVGLTSGGTPLAYLTNFASPTGTNGRQSGIAIDNPSGANPSTPPWPNLANIREIVAPGVDPSYGSGGYLGIPLQGINPIPPQYADPITASTVTFNVSDMRLAFQLQKWQERNARAGTRYTEFLRSHFGVSPTDSRLDRPEYIGGTKSPVVISEVLQTSATEGGGQLAAMGGHGLTASGQFAGKYHCQEFGLIIGMMSVMPRPSYQNGINRQWLRTYPSDFYFPEYSRLSEQAVKRAEVLYTADASPSSTDNATFGYVGQYDEMRVKHDIVSGLMRKSGGQVQVGPGIPSPNDNLSYWNLTRYFSRVSPPLLNSNFITCVPRKDIFLVPSEPGLMVNVQNLLMAARPMPLIADPGFIDHN